MNSKTQPTLTAYSDDIKLYRWSVIIGHFFAAGIVWPMVLMAFAFSPFLGLFVGPTGGLLMYALIALHVPNLTPKSLYYALSVLAGIFVVFLFETAPSYSALSAIVSLVCFALSFLLPFVLKSQLRKSDALALLVALSLTYAVVPISWSVWAFEQICGDFQTAIDCTKEQQVEAWLIIWSPIAPVMTTITGMMIIWRIKAKRLADFRKMMHTSLDDPGMMDH